MRYTVLTFRTFHNRITKDLGVLVGAALVATLLLPTAAQAQTPAAPTVSAAMSGTDGATLTATWGGAISGDQDQWLLEYTEPGVAWAKATEVKIPSTGESTSMPLDANDPRIHHGVWRFRVSYYDEDGGGTVDGADVGKVIGTASALTDYQHGPPTAAPTGFTAHPAGPGARRLVWDAVKGTTYDTRYTADATDDKAWTAWKGMSMSGMVVDKLKMGTEYTFELRALGASRAGVGDLHGPSASTAAMMPVPTPTLPEIAALFLAMLLLGSGAYLLRRRQSGGLTPA